MPDIKEVQQEIIDYSFFENLILKPETVRSLFTTNRIQRVIADLFAEFGSQAVRVQANAAGALVVSDTGMLALLTTIDAALAGTLEVNDVDSEALLTTINAAITGTLEVNDVDSEALLTTINAAITGTLEVNDVDSEALLTTIDAALAGTLDTDDAATQALLTTMDGVLDNILLALSPDAILGPGDPSIDSFGNAAINAATGARTQIIGAPGGSKQIWIYSILITFDTADVLCTLESAANALSGAMPQADNGGFCHAASGNFGMPFFKCNTNEAFNITMGVGVGDGICSYAIVSV